MLSISLRMPWHHCNMDNKSPFNKKFISKNFEYYLIRIETYSAPIYFILEGDSLYIASSNEHTKVDITCGIGNPYKFQVSSGQEFLTAY